MKTVDTRGLSCPEPVVLTKNEVDKNEKEIEVLTDTEVSKENVVRFLENSGYKVTVKEENEEAVITAKK